MARPLSVSIESAITQPATRPIYLIEIVIGTLTLRWATGRQVQGGGGAVWSFPGAEVSELTDSAATIRVPNHDNAWTAVVLGPGVRDAPVTIRQFYGSMPLDYHDLPVVFSGVLDSTDISDFVSIYCVLDPLAISFAPRLPLLLWVPAPPRPGTVIQWDGAVWQLERYQGG